MKILTDIHTHTIASAHAYSTITENAAQAASIGLEAIAMTDHAPEIPDGAHLWHFMNMKVLPDRIGGVRVLHGAEVNICDIHGRLDMPQELMEKLDIVISSIHKPCYADLDKPDHTEAYMSTVENPAVDIIGHSGYPDIPYDYETVIRRAGELGKLIEINSNSFTARRASVPNCRIIAEICKRLGVGICVNSDAHFAGMIGDFSHAVQMLEEIGFPEELIINRNYAALCEFLAPRKSIDKRSSHETK